MAPGIAAGDVSNIGNLSEGSYEGNFQGSPLMTSKNKLTALVDDDPFTRLIEKNFLTAYGVETLAVDNGQAASDVIYYGATFSLIVIDMHIQDMDSAKFARKLRMMGVTSRMVGLTAIHSEKEEHDFLDAGGNDFFEKPLSPSKFVPILQELDNQG